MEEPPLLDYNGELAFYIIRPPNRVVMAANEQQQSRLKQLITKGREQGFLTYAEVNDHLPQDIADPDQVEDIIGMINDMGITVSEQAPDAETLLMTDGDSTDEAAAEEAAEPATAEAAEATETVAAATEEAAGGMADLLTPEGFNLDKVGEMIDGSELGALKKTALKTALDGAKDNPELLNGVLEQIKTALGM